MVLISTSAFAQVKELQDLPLNPNDPLIREEIEKNRPKEPPPTPPVDTPPVEIADPPEFFGETFPTNDAIVYVIDRSGSMRSLTDPFVDTNGQSHFGLSRLDRAKMELLNSIAHLSPNLKFNVVYYSCSPRAIFPQCEFADIAHKAIASGQISAISPAGATGTARAVIMALTFETSHIILLTDGSPNCGMPLEHHEIEIITKANLKPSKVSTIGISDSGKFAEFLKNVASSTSGSYVHIE